MTTTLRSRISAHPTVAFFVLASAMSWTLMAPAMIAGLDSLAAVPFFIGVWAPRHRRGDRRPDERRLGPCLAA